MGVAACVGCSTRLHPMRLSFWAAAWTSWQLSGCAFSLLPREHFRTDCAQAASTPFGGWHNDDVLLNLSEFTWGEQQAPRQPKPSSLAGAGLLHCQPGGQCPTFSCSGRLS